MVKEDIDQANRDAGTVQDLAYCDMHQMLNSGKLNTQEKINGYNMWSVTYDAHCDVIEPAYMTVAAQTMVDQIQRDSAESSARPDKIRVLVGACGTGIPSLHLKNHAVDHNLNIDIVGVDFSPKMLAEAANKRKNVFSRLVEADLYLPLPLKEESFDAFYVIGLLLDGHCGPEVLPNITKCVKSGGIGVITVRRKTFIHLHDLYMSMFQKAGLDILHNFVEKYTTNVEANYVVFRRR